MKLKRTLAGAMSVTFLLPTAAMAADHEEAEMEPVMETSPASDLRSDLDYLLSEHFVLAVETMQKTYDEAPDAQETEDALYQNSKDMLPAIESVYGEEGAAEFDRIFTTHNDYTDDIVEAAKSGDEEARAEAEEEVEEFVVEFSTFLAGATEENLPQEAAEEAVRAHEMDVLNTFDSYVEGDYEAAYTSYREGFSRMFDISKALSGAIVTQMPEEFNNTSVDTPAADLRSDLNKLTAEHFALATYGMEKGVNQADDYDFVTWAEDQNTADFTAAISSIYGGEAGGQFAELWQPEHIDAQGQLVAAELEGDEEARTMALDHIDMFTQDFGAFLGAATEENLPTEAAQEALRTHEAQVLSTFDNYNAGDYEASTADFREGYQFMFGVGEALGGAISAQNPDQFGGDENMMPEEMPQTGMGGTSNDGWMTALWASVTALVGGVAALFIRKKKNA